jgi:mono/diheme cytochrome c family protein
MSVRLSRDVRIVARRLHAPLNDRPHGWRVRVEWLLCFAGLAFVASAIVCAAQAPSPASRVTAKLDTGKAIYEAGCVACHGPDGKGQPENIAGFERPATFPDFSDCPSSTPEADVQWRAIITNGGTARGFSQIMPSFKDLLTRDQIDKVIEHLRGLCTQDAWPRGNLNLPRAMITEKAFPENETVIAGSINATGAAGVGSTISYEQRIGASGMIEVAVPYAFTQQPDGWGAALGDVAIGYKQKLFHSLKKGSIFSVGGEVAAPSGNTRLGTGGESTVFEGYAAFGQLLPAAGFLQVQTGVELPAHPDDVPRAYYLRTAIGKSFTSGRGLGRQWSPMLEIVGDRDLVGGATTNWDIVPELQIPMSKRMHILGSVGVRLPINNTADRQKQVLFYVLWDWQDGSLTQGW